MVPWLLLFSASVRGGLARIAGLRWAGLGGFDLAVPAAIVVVVWSTTPQLGTDFAGVPFGVAWIALTAAIVAAAALVLRRLPAPESPGQSLRPSMLGLILVVGTVVSWVLYDIWFWGQTIHVYDLDVYLGSAGRWLDGGQPYLTAPLTAWPSSAGADFFLYPPPLLPVFGVLSRLPNAPVTVGWLVFLVACAYKSYRILGLSRMWSVALLAFPPVAIGFESGNVASVTFLLFVAAVRYGGTLIVDGFFKVQTGLPALWLIRQRRWRGILAGGALIAAIVAITLPIVGIDSWRTWWESLGYRATTQASVTSMYGYSMARVMPGFAFTAISAAMIVFALVFRGRAGLAALGLATVFASPALWPHGFVFALPALLMLENGAAVWLVLGAGAVGPAMWLLVDAGWIAVMAARRPPFGPLHPLAGTGGPWPNPRLPVATRRSAPPTVRVGATDPAD